MSIIHWAAFDWPSFATLAAGGMAVIGATAVGLRQARIADRQREILERQTKLTELALRHELFDKRYAVYQTTARFLKAQLSHRNDERDFIELNFLEATQEARFLFRSSVSEYLERIWGRSAELEEIRDELGQGLAAGSQPDEERRALSRSLRRSLREDLKNLADVFGPDLHLGDLD